MVSDTVDGRKGYDVSWPSNVDDMEQWERFWAQVGKLNSYLMLLREGQRRGMVKIISWGRGDELPRYEWLKGSRRGEVVG